MSAGVRLAVAECARQFRHDKWDCPENAFDDLMAATERRAVREEERLRRSRRRRMGRQMRILERGFQRQKRRRERRQQSEKLEAAAEIEENSTVGRQRYSFGTTRKSLAHLV